MPSYRHHRTTLHRHVAAVGLAAVLAGSGLLTAAGPETAHAAPRDPRAAAPTPHQVEVGHDPVDVAVAQSLGKAFVVNDSSITAVSLLTHRPLSTFAVDKASGQGSIALVQGETQAYVTHDADQHVSVFDTETLQPLRQIDVGGEAVDVTKANTSKGQRAYLVLRSTKALAVVQTRTGKVLPRVKLPSEAAVIATQPGGKYVWAGADDGRVFKVATTSGKVTTYRYSMGVGPIQGLAFSHDGKQLWFGGPAGLGRLSTSTGKGTRTVASAKIFTDGGVGALALGSSGRYLYAVSAVNSDNPVRGAVASINTRTFKVTYRVRTGDLPSGLAVDTHRDIVYTANADDDTLTYVSGVK